MTNLTYHGIFFCLLLAANEWSSISQHKVAAIFYLLAISFYLFLLSALIHETTDDKARINRRALLIKKKQIKRAGTAMIFSSLLFVVSWMPHSRSVQILFSCAAFFFLVFHLSTLSIDHLHGKTKKELKFKE